MSEKKRGLWWWVDRWRRSSAWMDMTLAEQGAYRNLLDELRLRGGVIPNDERVLAKACGDPLEWPNVREKVLAKFVLGSNGWTNCTATEVNGVTDAWSESQAAKGKARASGAARENGRFLPAQPAEAPAETPAAPPASVSVSGSVSVSVSGSGSTNGVGGPPADDRLDVTTENAIRKARWTEERELLVAVGRIAQRTGRDPPEVMREVTAYKSRDGTVVAGKANPAQLGSAERVTKSLEDAMAWLADLERDAAQDAGS